MTPKEKAEELYNKMRWKEYRLPAKSCALVAVDEIIYQMYDKYEIVDYRYWNEVKQEIEKL